MSRRPTPSFETLVLVFGTSIGLAGWAYWTRLGFARGEGWTSVGSSRALVVLGATVLMALIFRLARHLEDRPDDVP